MCTLYDILCKQFIDIKYCLNQPKLKMNPSKGDHSVTLKLK
jgi:hypothetical protein